MITKVKGTQDFIDLQLFNFIIDRAQKQCHEYNFSHIATPILEPTQLFKRSLGLETDVVTKEMYTFETSTGESICLRPEATASTVRAFIENGIQVTPWKVYSWGPMFRHERPQKGRYRQFHQFNIEVIGSSALAEDAQFIKMLDQLFSESLMLEEYALKINFLGTPEDRKAYTQKLDDYLETIKDKLCKTCLVRKEKNILRVFDCKNEDCKSEMAQAPKLVDSLSSESQEEWKQLQSQLELLSVSFTVDPTLVRGLDYYSKTVFEFASPDLGAQNAFCAGGRYNNLVTALGGKNDQPSIGASIGIERLSLMLETIKDKLPLPQPAPLTIIIPLSDRQEGLALLVSQKLHNAQITNDVLLEGSVKSMMRKANKMGASNVILLGDEEQEKHIATVKNMVNGTEQQVALTELAQTLK